MNEDMPAKDGVFRDVVFFAFHLALVGIASYFLWGIIYSVSLGVAYQLKGMPQAPLTTFFFDYRAAVRFFPTPWLLFALASSWRGRRTTRELLVFSSTLTLAMVVLSIVVAVALAIPWIYVPGQYSR